MELVAVQGGGTDSGRHVLVGVQKSVCSDSIEINVTLNVSGDTAL